MQYIDLPIVASVNGFDYHNQAWIIDGRYIRCGHPNFPPCGCFGRVHEGMPCNEETITRELLA